MRTSPMARACAVVLAALLSLSLLPAAVADEPVLDDPPDVRAATRLSVDIFSLIGRNAHVGATVAPVSESDTTPMTGTLAVYLDGEVLHSITATEPRSRIGFLKTFQVPLGEHEFRIEYTGDDHWAPLTLVRARTARQQATTVYGSGMFLPDVAAGADPAVGRLSVTGKVNYLAGGIAPSREGSVSVTRRPDGAVVGVLPVAVDGKVSGTIPGVVAGQEFDLAYAGNIDYLGSVSSPDHPVRAYDPRAVPRFEYVELGVGEWGMAGASLRVVRPSSVPATTSIAGAVDVLVDGLPIAATFEPQWPEGTYWAAEPFFIGYGPRTVTVRYRGNAALRPVSWTQVLQAPQARLSPSLWGGAAPYAGQRGSFSAYAGIERSGIAVVLQFRRGDSTSWRTVASARTAASGFAEFQPMTEGSGHYRALVSATPAYAEAVTPAVGVRVRRPTGSDVCVQNPSTRKTARVRCALPPAGVATISVYRSGRWHVVKRLRYTRSLAFTLKRTKKSRKVRIVVPGDRLASGVSLRLKVGPYERA